MKRDSFSKSVGIILLYYFMMGFLGAIYALLDIKSSVAESVYMCLLITALLGMLAYLLFDKFKGQWKDFKTNYKKMMPFILKNWLVGFLLVIAVNCVINFLITKGIAPNEEANREMLGAMPFFSIYYMCLLGPISEEMLFRLNFKNVFKSRRSFVLGTGLMFGAMHLVGSEITLMNMLYLIPYSLMGISFGYIYYESDNIFASTIAHVLNNSLAIATVLLNV